VRHRNRVERGLFICRDCGRRNHADVNVAFNILNKVSPAPAYAGVGVWGILSARRHRQP
jgi:putative transposase